MRFLIDECTGPTVARWLAQQGHDVASVYDDDPGIDDAAVVAWAADEQRILVTNDKDFGDRVFRDDEAHAGVILLRLDDERSPNKIAVLRDLLREYGQELEGAFVVASEDRVRFG
jgi:predicted nuclease of predicted toxin-antitoxin system